MNVLSQFHFEPHHDYLIADKNILRYLRGTIHHCLKYDGKEVKLAGFTNFDWGGSGTNGRSTTGGFFSLGSAMISWMSREQDHVSLSSVEDEYVVSCEVGKEAVWLRKLLSDLFGGPLDHIVINCDNKCSIKMSEYLVFHARMKHINNKYHYIGILVQDGFMKLQYILTYE